MVVRPDPGIISEVDDRARSLRGGPDRGVGLLLLPLHRLRILLISAVQWPLRREPELAQQPAGADHRQCGTEFAADHFADLLPGPLPLAVQPPSAVATSSG